MSHGVAGKGGGCQGGHLGCNVSEVQARWSQGITSNCQQLPAQITSTSHVPGAYS